MSYAGASTRIARTSRPCAMALIRLMRDSIHRAPTAIGCRASMSGKSSSSPKCATAAGSPDKTTDAYWSSGRDASTRSTGVDDPHGTLQCGPQGPRGTIGVEQALGGRNHPGGSSSDGSGGPAPFPCPSRARRAPRARHPPAAPPSVVDPDPILVVRVVDRRRDEQHLRGVLELPAMRRVGRDHPDVALLDGMAHAPHRHRSGPLEHVADLVMRLVDVHTERARMSLEDEDTRLRTMAEIRPLEDLGIGQLVSADRGGDVDDVDLGQLRQVLRAARIVMAHAQSSVWRPRRATVASNRK